MKQKTSIFTTKFSLILLMIILITSTPRLTGCSVIESIFAEKPTQENTYLTIADVNKAMTEAMMRGETEISFNIANASEDDLTHVAQNMSSFWGNPKSFMVNREFEELEGIVEGETVNVKKVTSTLELSDNYYVIRNIVDGEEIPNSQTNAQAIASALPAIIEEAFAGIGDSPYEKTLAIHDWLISNLTYDETVEENGPENGSYGAIIDRKTMCQGYAEAMQLLLTCYTNIENEMITGTAQSAQGEPWIGHAWNMVKMEDQYYHIDVTFDDPQENESLAISHFYFAQNDTIMSSNHKWEPGYFPVSEGEEFFYYKKSGLFANNKAEFETIVTNAVKNDNPLVIEVAAAGTNVNDSSLQFIFRANNNIHEIYWTEAKYGDISVYNFEPQY